MIRFHSVVLQLSVISYCFISVIQFTSASPTTIKNDALKNIDGVPSLGRGYSLTTNALHSTCFDVNGTTAELSYNFDYYFTDFTRVEKYRSNLASKISKSFGYKRVKSTVSENRKAYNAIKDDISKMNPSDGITIDPRTKYSVVVTLRIERFFTSLLETSLHLSDDAMQMLQDEEYINFFMACGPNYVRSLQRAQEVTAIITFESDDEHMAREFASSLRLYVFGNRGRAMYDRDQIPSEFYGFDMDFEFDDEDIRKSLSIEILGYGLGLNNAGSETLVSTSLDEFNQVMRFAFDSMTKPTTEDSQQQAGMVYGMEVVPWSDNSEFLKIADVDYNRILVPVPRGMIESAKSGIEPCLSPESETDDYGKCCDPSDIVNVTQIDGIGSVSTKQRCDPQQYLSPVIMKDNLETNAEFVSWLTSVARDKVKSLSTLGQCMHHLRATPERFDYMFLHSTNKARYDQSIEMSYTVKELRAALDPTANLEILGMLRNENDEFFEMFYQPCLSALYGMYQGEDRLIDPKFIMAEPWYNLQECSQPSCLESDMAWDRKNGNGCVPGILGRQSAESPIPYETDAHCAKMIDADSGEERCKYSVEPSRNIVKQMDNCREKLPQGKDGRGRPVELSLLYLMEYFCTPRVAMNRAQANMMKMDEVDASWEVCTTEVNEIAESPTPAPTTFPTNVPTPQPTIACGVDQSRLDISVTTDRFPVENSWTLTLSPYYKDRVHIPNTYCEHFETGECDGNMSFDEVWQKCLDAANDQCMGVMWSACVGSDKSDTSVNGSWKLMNAGQTIGNADTPSNTCGGKERARGHWHVFARRSMYNETPPPGKVVEESAPYPDFNTKYRTELCVSSLHCYNFTFNDLAGDGFVEEGKFSVSVNNEKVLSSPGTDAFKSLSVEIGECNH